MLPTMLVLQMLIKEIIIAHLAAQVSIMLRSGPKGNILAMGMRGEEGVYSLLALDRQIHATKDMVARIRPMNMCQTKKHHLHPHHIIASPTCMQRTLHKLVSRMSRLPLRKCAPHIHSMRVNMQINIIAGIVKQPKLTSQYFGFVMRDNKIGVAAGHCF